MKRSLILSAIAGATLSAAMMATQAQACQLVCITIPHPTYINAGNVLTFVTDKPTLDAACQAAKNGFKPAIPGMLASLPNPATEFFGKRPPGGGDEASKAVGAQNGLSCESMAMMMHNSAVPVTTHGATANPPPNVQAGVASYTNKCLNPAETANGAYPPTLVCCNM